MSSSMVWSHGDLLLVISVLACLLLSLAGDFIVVAAGLFSGCFMGVYPVFSVRRQKSFSGHLRSRASPFPGWVTLDSYLTCLHICWRCLTREMELNPASQVRSACEPLAVFHMTVVGAAGPLFPFPPR